MNFRRWLPVIWFLGVHPLLGDTLITFDEPGITDGTNIVNQFPNITLTNALVQTAGVSLNEIDFPPHSGTNVVIDNGGPIAVEFQTAIFGFGGFFTYMEPVTIDAFDSSSHLLATATSAFSNNTVTGGDSNSNPNEFLAVTSANGISEVTIAGDLAGFSFALDDVTISAVSPSVPEPGGAFALLTTLFVMVASLFGKLIHL